jgi:hypothetical protein
MTCPSWNTDRRECLGGLIDQGATFYNLLGGSKDNGGWTSEQVQTLWVAPIENDGEDATSQLSSNESQREVERRVPGFIQVAKYLQQVMPRRLRRLAVLLRTPRTDADINGMVALTEGNGPCDDDTDGSDHDEDCDLSVGMRLGPEISS